MDCGLRNLFIHQKKVLLVKRNQLDRHSVKLCTYTNEKLENLLRLEEL